MTSTMAAGSRMMPTWATSPCSNRTPMSLPYGRRCYSAQGCEDPLTPYGMLRPQWC